MGIEGLPELPAPHKELAKYIAGHPEQSIVDILAPYRKYEAQLRTVYAQDRQNPSLNDPYLNVVPLFTEDTKHITTRARDLAAESEEEKSRYIMSLPDDKRRPQDSPATVANISEFKKNFNIFSESSLVEIDWSNVVAAGSSVVNCLLPVPKEFNTTKRKLREYYHEKFCPASDVDLFLYGLTHEEAIEKIKQIEHSIRDALLNEVTVVRTKYAITIASQYPVRHVQIVLRVYKSISEILTGFDIDAAGGAYDGSQVYITPRAMGSFITQINQIDLTRRSPSYENRLSKYSHRNFEVYWPELDRTRIDPTIYERSFRRTLGLARLLVLERLPTSSARETYLNKRREERGRPTVFRGYFQFGGNIKDSHEDEVADWLSEEDVSNYHTFTVPYGLKFQAKKIEKLCYTRDLLLNAEWNQPKEREVNLHRHPAFFGRVEDVIEDCCGSCPKPVTSEEVEVAEKEAEVYISGKVAFLIDDPGRQQIGSFNPLTEQDWTDMAYVGNTARLCQSIVDGDVDDVLNWLSQEGADPCKRDYTGRSPLHLAVMTSTPEVVRCLVNHGARLTARLADGKTALHLAASRGNSEMIKILMEKSIENEEVEEERQDRRRKAAKAGDNDKSSALKRASKEEPLESDESDDESDGELVGDEQTDADVHSIATGSFVKVKKEDGKEEDAVAAESEDEPDYYQIDVLAWDTPCSPLHLAIVEGHEDAVKSLCDFGADSILPVKFLNKEDDSDTRALLTLTLALSLPAEKAKSMARLLLKLGATSSQADSDGCTAFHRYVENGDLEILEVLCDADKTGVKSAINHLFFSHHWNPEAIGPLHSAIEHGSPILVLKLLNGGALSKIDFETWLKSVKVSPSQSSRLGNLEQNQAKYREYLEQPLITAIRTADPSVAFQLLEHGADPNTLTLDTEALMINEYRRKWTKGKSALDLVRRMLSKLSKYKGEIPRTSKPQEYLGLDTYLQNFQPGTYAHWAVSKEVRETSKTYKKQMKAYEEDLDRVAALKGAPEKRMAIDETILELNKLQDELVKRGAKTFEELHPNIKTGDDDNGFRNHRNEPLPSEPKPYTFSFSFYGESDMTTRRKDGYLELMEAAWAGNLDRIKSLTLQAWGPEQDQPPLKMTIKSSQGDSALSLAFNRGYYDVVRAILDIVKAQWSPRETEKVRYRMETQDDDDDDEYNSEDDGNSEISDSEPRIVSQKVDKAFTIENIGQVSMQVESHDKPLNELIASSYPMFDTPEDGKMTNLGSLNLFVYAMLKDNTAGLKFLLELAQHHAGSKFEDDNDDEDNGESGGNVTLPQYVYEWAIKNGKVDYLGLLIKRTGAGIPLDHLVKKSGVELKQKPRYYQGLTVYGKKRNDWATAGRNMVVRSTGSQMPPLLHAALEGNIESVEFFLGDAPHRQYSEFGKSKAAREDTRLKHLKDSPGGFDRAISKWLGTDNDLVIHCAAMAHPSEQANELLQYLVETCPDSIERKSGEGDTPLMVACRLGRPEFVKILLGANADQSTKNASGENIVHAALAGDPNAHQLRTLLDLLDPDLRKHLFLQRKNLQQEGTTPLHTWVMRQPTFNKSRYGYYNPPDFDAKDAVAMLKLLLEYSNGEELEMLNGAGDTPLHSAVFGSQLAIVKVLLDFKPELLHRENAVGRTPAEIAHDRATAHALKKPERMTIDKNNRIQELTDKSPEEFVERDSVKDKTPEEITTAIAKLGLSDAYSAKQVAEILGSMGIVEDEPSATLGSDDLRHVIWDLSRTAMEEHPGRRRLVSLNEANDVAKRLGDQYTGSRYFSIQPRPDDDDAEDEAKETNEDEGRVDFATTELRKHLNSAWNRVRKSEGEPKPCPGCGEVHD